ncbi:SIMPL domain-containing protein [Pelomicrobium sp.]|jgi:predicted secreted protein|uniref:SIMPL domain-containing protein n=1 Tax=Pelomicrobium sp. TaxID=2815319 RepID=UPI002FDDD5F2
MHGRRWLVILAVGSMLGSGALRAEPGVGHDKALSGILTLEAEASAEVAHDLAVMILFVERQAENPAAAAEGVVQSLDETARQVQAAPQVYMRTNGAGTWPQHDPQGASHSRVLGRRTHRGGRQRARLGAEGALVSVRGPFPYRNGTFSWRFVPLRGRNL